MRLHVDVDFKASLAVSHCNSSGDLRGEIVDCQCQSAWFLRQGMLQIPPWLSDSSSVLPNSPSKRRHKIEPLRRDHSFAPQSQQMKGVGAGPYSVCVSATQMRVIALTFRQRMHAELEFHQD